MEQIMARQMGRPPHAWAGHQATLGFIERRASPRTKVFKKGKLIHTNMIAVFDCMIRDISETGARLSCGETAMLPTEMKLLVSSQREMCLVRIVWRKSREVGVQFLEARKTVMKLLV
jgi:hypothetical protein